MDILRLPHLQLFRPQSLMTLMHRNGNGAGLFGYPPRPAPNGMGYYFTKRVRDGFGIFFQTRAGFGAGSGIVPRLPAPPRPAPIIFYVYQLFSTQIGIQQFFLWRRVN